jgi:hypothetical protein
MLPKEQSWRDSGDTPYMKKWPRRGKTPTPLTPPQHQPTHSIPTPQ